MLTQWMIWLMVCSALGQVDDQPYCSVRYERLCLGKGPHVACQFPYRGHGEACENYKAIIFTNELKQFVLHYINRRRQKIASGHERVRGGIHLPKPELMMLVQWDRELAYLAQRLADQCQFVHDDCRATVRYPYAGQTVGEVRWRRFGSMEKGARRVIGRVFDAWWGERRRVQAKQLTSPFALTSRGAVWGHFSQLTVWTLRAMGCGAVHHGLTRPRLLLVCDFSHTNMLGQRTISPGPLAPCPQHTTRVQHSPYSLLCAPVRNLRVAGEDDRREDDEEHEEEAEEDEEQDQAEVALTVHRRPYNPESDDFYTTRTWPDRPVRPIQDVVDSTPYINIHSQDDLDDVPSPDDPTNRDSHSHEHSHRTDTDTLSFGHRHYDTVIRVAPPIKPNKNVIDRPFYETINENKRPLKPLQDERNTWPKESSRDDVAALKSRQEEFIDADQRPIMEVEELSADRIVKPIEKENVDDYEEKAVGNEDSALRWRAESDDRTTHNDEMVTKMYIRHRGNNEGIRQKVNNDFVSKEVEGALHNRQEAARKADAIKKHGTSNREETDVRNKAVYKTVDDYRSLEMRRKGEYKINKDMQTGQRMLEQWRDDRGRGDMAHGVLPLQKQSMSRHSITTIVVYRPTSLFSIATEAVLRSRYKQTRNRPHRPGVNALLKSTSPTLNRRKSKMASLMLDKDDEEQLYRDTGFKVSISN